jgi:hypothetical protein
MYGIMEPAAVFRANPVPWALSRARWQVLQSGPPELPSAPRSISREAFDQIVREHEGPSNGRSPPSFEMPRTSSTASRRPF